MDHKWEQFKNSAKNISLTPEELLAMRERITAFMVAHPMPREKWNVFRGRLVGAWFPTSFSHRLARIVFSALGGVLLCGGVVFAAEQSLPGDILYPMKVRVNEEVRSAMTLSPEAKVEWDAERLERRLEEAEKIAARGVFPENTRIALEENIKKQSAKVRARIEALEREGNVQSVVTIGSNMEAMLSAHKLVLKELQAAKTSSAFVGSATPSQETNEIEKFIGAIRNEQEIFGSVREHIEEKFLASDQEDRVTTMIGEYHEEVDTHIQNTRTLLQKEKGNFKAETTAGIEAQMQEAERLIEASDEKLRANARQESLELSRKASQTMRQTELLMRAMGAFDIEVDFEKSGSEMKDKKSSSENTNSRDTEEVKILEGVRKEEAQRPSFEE